MGGRDKVAPGKTTYMGDEMVGHDLRKPGKATLVTGMHRHRPPREELPDRIQDAYFNYKEAILAVRMETVLEKDDDLPWVAGLVLDVIGKHVGGVVEKLLKAPEGQTAAPILAVVQGTAKAALDASKKGTTAELRLATSAAARNKREEKLDYLKVLADEVFVSFAALREDLSAGSDEEVAAAHTAFEAKYHTPSIYEAALRAKLAAFARSGVSTIGRQLAMRGSNRVERDTRVVWLTWKSGTRAPLLAFERQDGSHTNDPSREIKNQDPRFGPAHALTDAPELGDFVPEEFVSTAIDRHVAVWGEPPGRREIDDTAYPIPRMTLEPTKPAPAAPPPTSKPALIDLPDAFKNVDISKLHQKS
jgi:hypothetical protein